MSASTPSVAVIGGGPAGLMAAEVLIDAGLRVDLYDAMASVGRKFLLAGKGGLNLTHAEDFDVFVGRYAERASILRPVLARFGPPALRDWARGLGFETFVGTSQRVFPADMKAAPLLRAWLKRLRSDGVQFHVRHRWLGWDAAGLLRFGTKDGERLVDVDATVLALGGGSWARLGSDGAWVPQLTERGVEVSPLRPSNCGFETGWSEHFRGRNAGQPVKPVVASCVATNGQRLQRQGEFVITEHGVEGSLIYALSAPLRDAIAANGVAVVELDLLPGTPLPALIDTLARPRGSQSLARQLHRLGIAGAKAGLLRELATREDFLYPARLAAAIKSLALPLHAMRPLDEAISSAGGVRFEGLDENLMLRARPGVFCAGEMLDWEAPTGGYLLTACFASGRAAAQGLLDRLRAGNHIASP